MPDFEISMYMYILLHVVLRLSIPIVLCLLLWQLWHLYNMRKRDRFSKLPLPPGSFGIPVIGETVQLVLRDKDFYDERIRRYGDIFKTSILGINVIRVIGAENIRTILNGENLIVTSTWPKSTQKLLGAGSLAMSSGVEHQKRRHVIMRAFTNDALSEYVPTIQEVVCQYISSWCGETTIVAFVEFRRMTFEIACKVLLGLNITHEKRDNITEIFETFTANLFSLPYNIPGLGFHKGLEARKKLLEMIRESLLMRNSYEFSADFHDAMSKLLEIEGRNQLTRREIEDSVLELMFAGHGTLTSAIFSLIVQLSKHPHIVEKLATELSEHNLLSDDNVLLDYETINKCHYAKNVVKEVLRIAPPVGAGYRKVIRTFSINGYQIPKGWSVAYSIRETHQKSKHLRSMEEFDPDRWGQCQTGQRFSYVPFGGSKNRGCIGKELAKLEILIFVVELIRTSTWKIVNGLPKIKYLPTPHPATKMLMTFWRKGN